MRLSIALEHNGHEWRTDGTPFDLSVPVNPHTGLPRAWYKGPATAEPVRSDGWIGSVAEGGAVNFRDLNFNPHAHGTHTETSEHIRDEFKPIDALARTSAMPFLMPAYLIRAQPEASGDDWIVPRSVLDSSMNDIQQWAPIALILQCCTGSVQRDWSNTNPPYLESGFAAQLVSLGIRHLLLDLPSVDKEVDGGVLEAHHAFFDAGRGDRQGVTISELLCVPDTVNPGPGLLALQVAPIVNDAAPSRPIWFPATVNQTI